MVIVLFLNRLLWTDILFVALTDKKLLFLSQCELNSNISPDFVSLIGYLCFAVVVVLPEPCVVPSPRTNILIYF